MSGVLDLGPVLRLVAGSLCEFCPGALRRILEQSAKELGVGRISHTDAECCQLVLFWSLHYGEITTASRSPGHGMAASCVSVVVLAAVRTTANWLSWLWKGRSRTAPTWPLSAQFLLFLNRQPAMGTRHHKPSVN